MTEQDVQAAQDAALGRYMRLKRIHAVATERVAKVGREMSEFAGELRQGAKSFQLPGVPLPEWLDAGKIRELLADLVNAEQEMRQARDRAITLGVALEKDQ